MIAFRFGVNINKVVGNGKRFMAYALVKKMREQQKNEVLGQMQDWVNKTQRLQGKKHEVFEPSFDIKECRSIPFMARKTEYIHLNPCKESLVQLPEDYVHSSAKYYYL